MCFYVIYIFALRELFILCQYLGMMLAAAVMLTPSSNRQ